MNLVSIGIVVEGYQDRKSAPRHGIFENRLSRIEIHEEFIDGLEGLENYRRIFVLYWLHLSKRDVLRAKPPGEKAERGVFSTRSPERPNPIGLSVVELVKMKENILTVRHLDAVTGTPVIDIKPFLKEIDCPEMGRG